MAPENINTPSMMGMANARECRDQRHRLHEY